jgi:hypothetical protein
MPASGYRLSSKGWLVALEVSGIGSSADFSKRLGGVLGTMKNLVKGRQDSRIIPLSDLATRSGEPEGFLFNIVDSRSPSTGNSRIGAHWYDNERGRLVEIPIGFNLEPVDIGAALTVPHLGRIEELTARLEEVEADRSQFHCPYCDAPISKIDTCDYPEYHCVVTYENFECGYATGDGYEECPCPYGPNWPALDEFVFDATVIENNRWTCYPTPQTARAKTMECTHGIHFFITKEEAEQYARNAVAPMTKGVRRGPTDMFSNLLRTEFVWSGGSHGFKRTSES